MVRAKFKIGDKVRFTDRVCRHASRDLHQRTRTIAFTHYDPIDQCVYYELHGRGKTPIGFFFRSYMLKAVTRKEQRKRGQPRILRKYQHKEQLLRPFIEQYFKRKDYIVHREFELNGRFIDFVVIKGKTTAIELKWIRWKEALEQALRNKPYFNYSYIALPAHCAHGADEALFQQEGIGLIRVNLKEHRVSVAIVAKELLLDRHKWNPSDHLPGVVAYYPYPQNLAVKEPTDTITKNTDIPAMARAGGHRIKSEKTVGNESPVLVNSHIIIAKGGLK